MAVAACCSPGLEVGKTTLAAALVAAGADFVTDDHAPLGQASWRVWPVPYAPTHQARLLECLKQRYPELLTAPVYELEGVRVRHLAPDRTRVAPLSSGLPVEALVFPRDQADVGLEQRQLSAAEALTGLFHARSTLDLRPDFLAETLRWVRSILAYEPIFGDLDRAVDWVLSLRCVK